MMIGAQNPPRRPPPSMRGMQCLIRLTSADPGPISRRSRLWAAALLGDEYGPSISHALDKGWSPRPTMRASAGEIAAGGEPWRQVGCRDHLLVSSRFRHRSAKARRSAASLLLDGQSK